MEYTCYQEAYTALVKDNDGVLPDLYEVTNITILGNLYNSMGALTVADIVAHALVEISALKPVEPGTPPIILEQLYLPMTPGEPLQLAKLLNQAIVASN